MFPSLFHVDSIANTYLIIRLFGYIKSSVVTVLSEYKRTIGNHNNILFLRIIAVVFNLIFGIIFVHYGFGIIGV